jgi:integral membrane sensor domain MASE1
MHELSPVPCIAPIPPAAHTCPVAAPHRYFTTGVQILAVALAYYVAAKIGLELALVRGQVTPLWPPTGISLTCLLVFGIRCWPGITAGAFLINSAIGPTFLGVTAISAGNTLAPVCAYLLLTRVGFRTDLKRLKDVIALITLGAFTGMLVSSTIGTSTLVLTGALPGHEFWVAWSVWWTGDAMGVLVVAPVLLVAATARPGWHRPLARWLEATALFVGLTVIVVVVTGSSTHLLFLIFPMLIWAALRFRQAGATPGVLLVTVMVVLAAVAGRGPFAGLDLLETMLTLQLFNGAVTLTALLLAAITNERDEAQRSVQRAVSQLSDAVATLEPYSLLRTSMLRQVMDERDASSRRSPA